ncbi:IclR family transcriptional regulator [Acidisoma cellulosilytica]|uniref:IclR family transcriptional regulator n=1 Tax=Acidisoma cellulosilyticum TaxID=2802395 RepID=A0A964E3Y0_9PROT|nr:IclR family transcriptional regulator [Acidisoma cellulosilyticum]MCB8880904.1 IclR family transcriptional regulator [Acidisoma cellulosilyticum]
MTAIPDPAKLSPDVPGTAVIAKTMRLLQAVADAKGPAKLGDLCRLTGFPRPTVHRLLAVLAAEGMIVADNASGAFTLGPRLISLAFLAWDGSDLRRIAQPFLVALRDSTDETVHLAVPSGAEMVYIDKLESRHVVRMASRIGTRVSLHSSSVGKAFLASLPVAALEKLLQGPQPLAYTPHTKTAWPDIGAEISATRSRGYALDLQENELDICCFGAAITGADGKAAGCISVSMPRYRFEAGQDHTILEALKDCVARIALALAAMPPG